MTTQSETKLTCHIDMKLIHLYIYIYIGEEEDRRHNIVYYIGGFGCFTLTCDIITVEAACGAAVVCFGMPVYMWKKQVIHQNAYGRQVFFPQYISSDIH